MDFNLKDLTMKFIGPYLINSSGEFEKKIKFRAYSII